jgi:hypothetical protein
VRFDLAAQQITLADYVHEVAHAAERIARLERAIDEALVSTRSIRALRSGRIPSRALSLHLIAAGSSGSRLSLSTVVTPRPSDATSTITEEHD